MKAQTNYDKLQQQLKAKLTAIEEMLENHQTDKANWADVSDLAQVNDQVDEVIDFLGS